MAEDDLPLEARSDHDLLILAVQELGHVKGHLADLTKKVGVQNGRLSAVEKSAPEDTPRRLSALEHWRIGMTLVLGFVGVAWPLLIYEVRQFVLDKFGFIP